MLLTLFHIVGLKGLTITITGESAIDNYERGFKIDTHTAYSCFEGTSFISAYLAKATGR